MECNGMIASTWPRTLPLAPVGQRPRNTCRAASTNSVGVPPKREVVVGIDLGTTNSAVACIENGKPRCIPNKHKERITPSVVAFLPDGDVVVGKEAKQHAATDPGTTYYSVKRLIGRPFADPVVQEERNRLAYKVQADDKGQVALACSAVPRGFIYPEEVSAQVLVQLLDDAEQFTKGQVKKAVISVPAYFNVKQREATVNAGQLAGLDTVRIIREPVAAALAYGLKLKEDQTVLVFDLGGGTYDISLLEVGNGTIEVLSTGGDAHLGGDDWDAAIVRWLTSQHLQPAGLDPRKDPRLAANVRALAEAAKKELSTADSVVLRMPVGGPQGGPLEVPFTRKQLEQLTQPLWRQARLPLDKACWAAGVDLNSVMADMASKREELRSRGVASWKIDTMQPQIRPKARAPLSKVLLVGGATRSPAVTAFIRNMTSLEPEAAALNPDEAVALGAAVQAGILQGEVKDLMVMDQWQASLMRALAQMKLKQDKAARADVASRYELNEEEIGEEDAAAASEAQAEEQAILRRLDEEHEAEEAAQARAAKPRSVAGGRDGRPGEPSEGAPAQQRAKRRVVVRPRTSRRTQGAPKEVPRV
ncbi:Hsp70 protein-domain-containing protein [Haematococcus lacustris]